MNSEYVPSLDSVRSNERVNEMPPLKARPQCSSNEPEIERQYAIEHQRWQFRREVVSSHETDIP